MGNSLDKFFSDIYDRYDVTPIEYRAAYRAQGGRCYCCRKADGTSRRLGIDHNHLTGEVRALVCTGSRDPKTCNRLIAYYSRPQLIRAAEILSDPPPLRAVLAAIRSGEEDPLIPSLVGNPSFRLSEIKR
jgi:Recombination endonuclease VII